MQKQIKAVIYARVSSKEQADRETSIPAQLEVIRSYCNQKGWIIIEEFIDSGKSAKTDDRPEFQRMITLAKKKDREFNAIIVHKFDRFSRNRDDHIIYKSLLKKIGVTVYSVTEQTDPDTPHGFLLEGIMEVISEFYNMNLKEESTKGLKQNAMQGYHNGGRAPYGYRLSNTTSKSGAKKTTYILGPDNEVETVRRIFHMAAGGKNYCQIAQALNDDNIPTYYNKHWKGGVIKRILRNEAYIGNMVWNITEYGSDKRNPESEWIRFKNSHPTIVEHEVFILAKSLIYKTTTSKM